MNMVRKPLHITADELQIGDELVNIGLVAGKPQTLGMFVVTPVSTSYCSLGTGRITPVWIDVVRHVADQLWIVRSVPEEDK